MSFTYIYIYIYICNDELNRFWQLGHRLSPTLGHRKTHDLLTWPSVTLWPFLRSKHAQYHLYIYMRYVFYFSKLRFLLPQLVFLHFILFLLHIYIYSEKIFKSEKKGTSSSLLLLDFCSCTGLVSRDKIPQVITRFYLFSILHQHSRSCLPDLGA